MHCRELFPANRILRTGPELAEAAMHGIIYIVGLIVVILAVLSFFGLR